MMIAHDEDEWIASSYQTRLFIILQHLCDLSFYPSHAYCLVFLRRKTNERSIQQQLLDNLWTFCAYSLIVAHFFFARFILFSLSIAQCLKASFSLIFVILFCIHICVCVCVNAFTITNSYVLIDFLQLNHDCRRLWLHLMPVQMKL